MTLSFTEEPGTDRIVEDRQALADDLLNELTAWSPRDRFGTLKTWHQGALSLIHLNVLTVLEARGSLSMSHLAEALDVSDASATGIVTRMERRGLVERQHGVGDRRVVMVQLTECGADVFRDLEAHRRVRLARLLGELTEAELAGFLVGLRAMRAAGQRLFHGRGPGNGTDDAIDGETTPDVAQAPCAAVSTDAEPPDPIPHS